MANVNKPLIVIFAAIGLDAVGIGLVFPILPRLLADVTHTTDVATYIGIITTLYALMQFVFAPLLGVLSDNIGRRPVLLISLAGAALNYFVMAFAPALWMLLVGRALAGISGANIAVATAYITDISPEDRRVRRFGFFSAMFGIGFIIGPVLGGLLGDYWVRLPFIAAGVLNAANFLLALFVLPESRTPASAKVGLAALNPFAPLKWVFKIPGLLPIVLTFFFLNATGEAYGTCWALWGFDAFGWNGFWIGLSLGTVGVFHTLVQMFLPGPATKLLGDRWAVLVGVAFCVIATIAMAFAKHGWVVFAMLPLFGLGDVGIPALQALATRRVSEDRQGELQGVLASAMSMASIIAPLGFTTFYFMVQKSWPGAVWLSVVVVYLIAVPLVFVSTRAEHAVSTRGTAT
jgi:DHA1 family tetracycline resistance protein-like MFS transporter